VTSSRRRRASKTSSVQAQLDAHRAERFWRHDLAAALVMLSRDGLWESLPAHGGGRRLTVAGITVDAFHLFVSADDLDPRPDALVVYAVDIWPDGFPEWNE